MNDVIFPYSGFSAFDDSVDDEQILLSKCVNATLNDVSVFIEILIQLCFLVVYM